LVNISHYGQESIKMGVFLNTVYKYINSDEEMGLKQRQLAHDKASKVPGSTSSRLITVYL